MRCELCKKDVSKEDIHTIKYQPFTSSEHYATYDYVCGDCLMKIKQFVDWITQKEKK